MAVSLLATEVIPSAQRRRAVRLRFGDLMARRGALAPRGALLADLTAMASISTRSSGFTSRETMRSVLGGYTPPGKYRGNASRRACMKLSMSDACVRKVWNRITSDMPEPAAASTDSTFSKACFVWATTSPRPTTLPARSVPTCPATTTSSPAGAVMPWEYMPSAGPSSFDVTGFGGMARLAEPDVFEVDGLAVDAAGGRSDPTRECPGLDHRLHEALHEGLVLLGGQPLAVSRIPLRLADHAAIRRHLRLGECADGPMAAAVRQGQLEVDAVPPDHLVPPRHAARAVRHVVVAQPLVQGDEGRLLAHHDPVAVEGGNLIGGSLELVVVLLLGLLEAPLEPRRVEVGGVGGNLRAEEIEGDRAVEVQVPLDGAQVDPAVLPEVVRLVLAHQLAGALDDAHDARLPHEHVVRFLGEHEATGARERIEAALGQARELILAVAVGEEAEHEVGEPVRRLLVEGAEDARLVAVSRAALEQRLRFLTPVAAKVGVEEVDHGPEVPSLLHVDLEQVTKVIE